MKAIYWILMLMLPHIMAYILWFASGEPFKRGYLLVLIIVSCWLFNFCTFIDMIKLKEKGEGE
jgi:hypothetical protein